MVKTLEGIISDLQREYVKSNREPQISIISEEALGKSWIGIVGRRELERVAVCAFGLAEEVIAFMSFSDGTYEVGVGECCRPYIKAYFGSDEQKALQVFHDEVKAHCV